MGAKAKQKNRTEPRKGKSPAAPTDGQAKPQAKAAEARAAKPPMTRLQAIVELARRGRRELLGQLEEVFDENPSLWQEAGDLVRLTEQAWLDKICGTNLYNSQAMRRHVERMKKDLAGPDPSPTEKLLAERAAACWLAAQHADLTAATGEGAAGAQVAQLRLKQSESANRRLLAAVKSLAVVRRLAGGLKIEISHTDAAAGGREVAARSSAPAGGGATDRLRGLVNEAAALETA